MRKSSRDHDKTTPQKHVLTKSHDDTTSTKEQGLKNRDNIITFMLLKHFKTAKQRFCLMSTTHHKWPNPSFYSVGGVVESIDHFDGFALVNMSIRKAIEGRKEPMGSGRGVGWGGLLCLNSLVQCCFFPTRMTAGLLDFKNLGLQYARFAQSSPSTAHPPKWSQSRPK